MYCCSKLELASYTVLRLINFTISLYKVFFLTYEARKFLYRGFIAFPRRKLPFVLLHELCSSSTASSKDP